MRIQQVEIILETLGRGKHAKGEKGSHAFEVTVYTGDAMFHGSAHNPKDGMLRLDDEKSEEPVFIAIESITAIQLLEWL